MASAVHPYSTPKLTFSQKVQFLRKIKENKSKLVKRFRSRAPRWLRVQTWKSIALFLRQIGVVFDRDEVQTVKLIWTTLRFRAKAKLLRLQRRWKPFDPATALNEVERLVLELFGEYDPVKKTLAEHVHRHPVRAPDVGVSAAASPAAPISEAFKKYMEMKQVDGCASTSSYRMQNTECSPKEQRFDSEPAGSGSTTAANDEFIDDLSKLITIFTTEGEAEALLIPPTVTCIGSNRMYPFGLQCCHCREIVAYLRSPGLWKRNDATGVSQMDVTDNNGDREYAVEWATLESHLVRHHSNLGEIQRYRCDLCHSKFDCLEDFYRHSYRRLPRGYFCLICRCPFAGFGTIRVHLKSRHAVELELGNGSTQFQVKKCSVQQSRVVQKARLSVVSKLSQENNTDRKIEPAKHTDKSVESSLNKQVEPTGVPSVQSKEPGIQVAFVGTGDESAKSVEILDSALSSNLPVSRQPEMNSVSETYDGVIVKRFVSATEAAEFGARTRTLCDGRPIGHTKTNLSWVFCGNCPVAESFRFQLIRWDNDLEETLFDYWQHVERCHSNLPLAYKCFVCGKGFTDRETYLRHAFRFPTSGYCCQRCGLTMTKSSSYFKRYHECELFDSRGADFWHINSEISSTSNTANNCSRVNSHTDSVGSSRASESRQYKCSVCPKVYTSFTGFKSHNRTKHMARNKPILGNGKAVKSKLVVSSKSKSTKSPMKPASTSYYTVNNRSPYSPVISSYSGFAGSDPGKSGKVETCAPVKRASQMSDQLCFVGNESGSKLVKNERSLSAGNPDFRSGITLESPPVMCDSLPVPKSEIKLEPCDAGLFSNVASDIVYCENVANVATDNSLPVDSSTFNKDSDCTSMMDSKDCDLSVNLLNRSGCDNVSGSEIKIEPVDVEETEFSDKGIVVESTEPADDVCKIWNGDECGASVKCETKFEI